jgi:glycosyltransferase involved in cell wall biosynthesis
MLSIAIPCYEYRGKGAEILEYSFEKMRRQTYKNFDVVIADHSVDDQIENLCCVWSNKLDIKYFRNENGRGNAAVNTNFSIRNCKGDLIKLLCQDDYLFDRFSLEKTVRAFDDDTNWLASAYMHTFDKIKYFRRHLPTMNPRIYVVNTIGTPSCVTLRNVNDMPLMDSNLSYYYDCDFYKRFADQYGMPKIISDITVVNVLWENSISASVNNDLINREMQYILKKYGVK